MKVENQQTLVIIRKMIEAIEHLIPEYMKIPEDAVISQGNIAVCIIDGSGMIHGKLFGTNRPRLRHSYKVAWIKASQVWLTGVKTGEYEKMVFNREVGENANGIEAPDLIGWEGGQPISLKSGEKLSVGVSGLRGISDLEIAARAIVMAEQA